MLHDTVDYAKLSYRYKQHHKRFVKYVEEHGLRCPACGGWGQYLEEMLDDWLPRYEHCGLCEGTGKCTRKMWGLYMNDLKREKKERNKRVGKIL